MYQKRELLTFVMGDIGHWLIVGIGYYLDNYLPFNKLIPKTCLTNPSDFMSQFQCLLLLFMKCCIFIMIIMTVKTNWLL